MFEENLLFGLYSAYLKARKGKRKSSDVHAFELRTAENLLLLRDEILSRNYSPGRSSAFIICDPVPLNRLKLQKLPRARFRR